MPNIGRHLNRAAGQNYIVDRKVDLHVRAAAWLWQTSEIRESLYSAGAFQKEAILF